MANLINVKCTTCGQRMPLIIMVSNAALASLKGVAGWISGSMALLADALHSLTDVVCALATALGISISNRSVDKNHPYGYGKIEFVVGGFIGIALLFAAGNILFFSVKLLFFTPAKMITPPNPLALWVAIISIYANFLMSHVSLCASEQLNSPALKALAADNRSDAYSSIPVAIAVLGSQVGFPQLDSFGALFVGLLITKIALGLVKENYDGLMDVSLEPETLQAMGKIVTGVPGVKKISYLKTRQLGQKVWVDTQVVIDGAKTASEMSYVLSEVRSALMRKFATISNVQVTVKPL